MELTSLANLEILAPQIADAINALEGTHNSPADRWTVEPQPDESDYHRQRIARLLHPSGRKLYLNTHHKEGRLHVSCGWLYVRGQQLYPREYMMRDAWDKLTTSINVGLSKSPAQMARDITRRLMPSYLTAWDVLLKHKAEQDRAHNDALELARALADATGYVLTDYEEQRLSRDAQAYIRAGDITFGVHSHGCKVESYSLNRARALQLAALAASWAREDAAKEEE